MSTPMGLTTFRCPDCSQLLETVNENEYIIFMSSIGLATIVTYLLGYRGLMFALVTIGLASLILLFIVAVRYHIWPPKVQQTSRGPDIGLRL
jgi:small-conductance mechanosensitive channel